MGDPFESFRQNRSQRFIQRMVATAKARDGGFYFSNMFVLKLINLLKSILPPFFSPFQPRAKNTNRIS